MHLYLPKKYTRKEIKTIAIIAILVWLFLGGYALCNLCAPKSERYLTGEFREYEVKTHRSLAGPSRRNRRYYMTIDSQTYMLESHSFSCFQEELFLQEVSRWDTIVVYLDENSYIIGVESNGNTYLSVSDARRAISKSYIRLVVVAVLFIIVSICLLIFAKTKEEHKSRKGL